MYHNKLDSISDFIFGLTKMTRLEKNKDIKLLRNFVLFRDFLFCNEGLLFGTVYKCL